MRIIAGRLRGRAFRPPITDATRPVTDRVKQALFDSLQVRLAPNGFDGLRVADLFSGTGSMGLESLSRGAVWCTFVEQDRSAAKLLQANLAEFDLQSHSLIERIDVFKTPPAAPPGGRFEVIFLDPPYRYALDCAAGSPVAALIERLAPLAADGPDRPAILVVRALRGSRMPDRLPGWQHDEQSIYGTMQLDWFTRCPTATH